MEVIETVLSESVPMVVISVWSNLLGNPELQFLGSLQRENHSVCSTFAAMAGLVIHFLSLNLNPLQGL